MRRGNVYYISKRWKRKQENSLQTASAVLNRYVQTRGFFRKEASNSELSNDRLLLLNTEFQQSTVFFRVQSRDTILLNFAKFNFTKSPNFAKQLQNMFRSVKCQLLQGRRTYVFTCSQSSAQNSDIRS